jgi:hypothetical protein
VSDLRDQELLTLYQDGAAAKPSRRVRGAILTASQKAVGSEPRSAPGAFVHRWGSLFAIAAAVVLGFALIFSVESPRDSEMNVAVSAPDTSSLIVPSSTRSIAEKKGGAALATKVDADGGRTRSPEEWLEDIRKLIAQGDRRKAEAEFGKFKERYPKYRLPEEASEPTEISRRPRNDAEPAAFEKQ